MARFAQVQTENAQYVAVHLSGVTLFFDLDRFGNNCSSTEF